MGQAYGADRPSRDDPADGCQVSIVLGPGIENDGRAAPDHVGPRAVERERARVVGDDAHDRPSGIAHDARAAMAWAQRLK